MTKINLENNVKVEWTDANQTPSFGSVSIVTPNGKIIHVQIWNGGTEEEQVIINDKVLEVE